MNEMVERNIPSETVVLNSTEMQTVARACDLANRIFLWRRAKRTDIDASQFPGDELRQLHADLNAALRQSEYEADALVQAVEDCSFQEYTLDIPECTVTDVVAALDGEETWMLDAFTDLRDLARRKWLGPSNQERLADF